MTFELVRDWREMPRSLVEVNSDGTLARVQIFCQLAADRHLRRLVAQACRMVCSASEALKGAVRDQHFCWSAAEPPDEQALRAALSEVSAARDGAQALRNALDEANDPRNCAAKSPLAPIAPPTLSRWAAAARPEHEDRGHGVSLPELSRPAGRIHSLDSLLGAPGLALGAADTDPAMSDGEAELDPREIGRIAAAVEQVAREKGAHPDFGSGKLKSKAFNYIRSVSANHLLCDAVTEAVRQQLAGRLRRL